MTDSAPSQLNPPAPRLINNTVSRRFGVITTAVGLLLFVLGSVPQLFGLDNSVAIGFVQIGVFTLGLLLICIGGSFALNSLWPRHWRSIAADIGLRVAWSGWVMSAVAALADIIGLGTRPLATSYIFYGFWQARGVLLGEVLIFIGFFMMIPFQKEFPPEFVEESAVVESPTEGEAQEAAEEQSPPEEESKADSRISISIEEG